MTGVAFASWVGILLGFVAGYFTRLLQGLEATEEAYEMGYCQACEDLEIDAEWGEF